ncbi:glycosyltransferase, partial [Gottfriedia acidiceleris]|uniref:glycosyltransferase n=1 Tax=Gottfriedia acidiceleris TaxID=371036 RepID=UPI002FFEB74F
MLKILFVMSLVLLIFPYIFYPIILIILNKVYLKKSYKYKFPKKEGLTEPHVDLIIPVYNEEKMILKKLSNISELEYDFNKLKIYIGCDGCTDNSVYIIKDFIKNNPKINIYLYDFKKNSGKSEVLNKLIKLSSADIVVFSDATTLYQKDVISKLCSFEKYGENVVGISGAKVMSPKDNTNTGKTEGFYWSFENKLKILESKVFSVIGADGPVFSIKREYINEIPDGIILDDLYLSMLSLNKVNKIVHDPTAIGYEESSQTYEMEYIRRKRLSTGAYQFLKIYLLNKIYIKWTFGVNFCFISHKVIRWLSPIFMLICFISNFGLILLNDSLSY